MKIGRDTPGINNTGAVKSGTRSSRQAGKSGQSTVRGDDEVSLTSHALQIKALEDLAEKAPVVDAERVEEIRLAIAEGRLKVDSDAIAGKLLAAVQELALKARR